MIIYDPNVPQSVAHLICVPQVAQFYLYFKYKSVYVHENSSNESNVPQSVAHLICVPQVPQMWHKMWHSSGRWYCIILFFLGTGFTFTSISPPVQSAQTAPDDIASYFFPRNKVYIHLYLTPCPISSDHPRTLCRVRKMLAGTPMCHKVWHIWYVCHKCHKCGTKCGTGVHIGTRSCEIKFLLFWSLTFDDL